MKDNDVQAAVKSQVAPTLGADSGPAQTAKRDMGFPRPNRRPSPGPSPISPDRSGRHRLDGGGRDIIQQTSIEEHRPMSRHKQNVSPAVPSTVPEAKAEVESKAAPKEASDDGREARDREIIRAFMEVAPLFAEVLERQVDLAIRREAKEPEFHFEIKEESTAWRRYREQIQEVVGLLQALKKLVDKRLKGLLEAQRWFDSLGN